jgi:hypothetical protein
MADYRKTARRAAIAHGLDPDIFERQIGAESGFNPSARSPAGALGIAQIMPATARGWGVDPLNPRAALNAAAQNMARYVKEFGSYDKALRAYNAGPGNVERSKGFGETNAYVKKILSGTGARAANSTGTGTLTQADVGRRTITTPGQSFGPQRAALIQSFLEDQNADPVAFAVQARALQDIPATTRTISTGAGERSGTITGAGGSGLARTATQRANVINAQQLPYKWGGGHAGKTPITKAVPLDCSGAVSKVLGIDPRVSGDFAKWGSPGDGGSKGVTVYSNGHHVLMKINGHFFGTSTTNPRGGAGWIKQEDVSPEYLKGFTARHKAA